MTPSVRPALAEPTDKKPVTDIDMPVGNGAPLGETPNVPPLRTPVGNVVDRSNTPPVPVRKYGVGLTLQVPGGGGRGGGVGVGEGVGEGVGAGAGPGDEAAACTSPVESFQIHPETKAEQPYRPSKRTLLRLF
jgi:hypothetical protein